MKAVKMIYGIGTDIVQIDRVEKTIARLGDRFLTKNFTQTEIEIGNSKAKPHIYFAKRFTVKEAFAKALRTGIGEHAAFCDIETLNNKLGAPYINLYNAAKKSIDDLVVKHDAKTANIQVSISDEKEYAQAFVIIELL